MRQLFGTDGIRAVAGEYPLDRATVYAIGRALGTRLMRRSADSKVVLGLDTRESSAWIAETMARGLRDAGCGFASAGVLTTPGVAYLTRTHGFAAGVVISASHNPWQDNGIKLFGQNGMKLADEIEHEIEAEIFEHIDQLLAHQQSDGDLMAEILPGRAALRADYERWLASNVDVAKFSGLRVLVDCAHGAASVIAPELLGRIGITFEALHTTPNGRNINDGCGALHPEHVADEMKRRPGQFDLGITLDGDADRALFSDAKGNVVNGDSVLLVAALDMKARGVLAEDTVVATTMSNLGLEKALRSNGITMLRADVGDKYVLEQMLKTHAALGGEQSGHILFMDGDSTTGDGLLTALRVLDVVARSGKSLHELTSEFKVFPQEIRNVRVREKVPMKEIPSVAAAIRDAEEELAGNGRLVVRYSGTEKLARVMIEAESESLMHKHVDAVAGALKAAIGS
ncbi:MAG TPA: phosphoglucosamine mutase [Candidatus Saccharimonadales bacterium]|nr:phosphoglucosamine mutase [Candidatus Saccharimonadales bacterium]